MRLWKNHWMLFKLKEGGMQKRLRYVGGCLWLMCCMACVSVTAHNTASKQSNFFAHMLPLVRAANADMAQLRAQLLLIQKKPSLSVADQRWLVDLAKRTQLPVPSDPQKVDWAALLQRVDTVPAGLVLAQAAIESAWGQSRFALDGNNYFGRWCFNKGCGLVPKQRPKGSTYEVKVFPSVMASVQDYLWNINTVHAYVDLRAMRYKMRQDGKTLSSQLLAEALDGYSQEGDVYIKKVKVMIQQYDLDQYDQ
jgi:Bax protein